MTYITIVDEKNPNNFQRVELLEYKDKPIVDKAGVDITDEQIQKNIDDSKSILNMLSGVEL